MVKERKRRKSKISSTTSLLMPPRRARAAYTIIFASAYKYNMKNKEKKGLKIRRPESDHRSNVNGLNHRTMQRSRAARRPARRLSRGLAREKSSTLSRAWGRRRPYQMTARHRHRLDKHLSALRSTANSACADPARARPAGAAAHRLLSPHQHLLTIRHRISSCRRDISRSAAASGAKCACCIVSSRPTLSSRRPYDKRNVSLSSS